jgi:isopentenyl phosphate kinase
MVKGMSIKPTVLKLGGSVITNKKKPATANLKAIERLADEISRANVSHLILVHG